VPLDWVFRGTLVPSLITVTFAPGTTAPLLSVTRPVIVPDLIWPKQIPLANISSANEKDKAAKKVGLKHMGSTSLSFSGLPRCAFRKKNTCQTSGLYVQLLV
jgi:hypothetical protein